MSLPLQPSIEDVAHVLLQCRKRKKQPQQGFRLYTCLRRRGIECHKLQGNHLVLMLAEIGCTDVALNAFNRLRYQNDRSWHSLISGFVKSENPEEALRLYHKMQDDESIEPTSHIYVAALRACAMLKDLERGIQIHSAVNSVGLLEQDVYVGSALIDMYVKCGSLATAQELFDTLPYQDVVIWNSLIAGYAKYGQEEKALKCFEKMQLDGISPTVVTFVCILKACSQIRAVAQGTAIHEQLESRKMLEGNIFLGNTLVDMYAKWGWLEKAQEVFDKLCIRDVVTWNALIAGYVEHGCGKRALECFEEMKLANIFPDSLTFICCLKACSNLQDVNKGCGLHKEILENDFLNKDLMLGNSLVDMYAKCGLLTKARNVFDVLSVRNVVTWNTLISGYVSHGDGQEALRCFKGMLDHRCEPDSATYICCLKACSLVKSLYVGREIHAEMERKGLLDKNILLNSSLVDMYAKCGLVPNAQEIFDKLPIRNIIVWTTLISGYTENGYPEAALHCFRQMKLDGFSPDAVTFVCSLKACANLKAAEKGQEIAAEIETTGFLENDTYIGSALVDMYAKCGLLENAWKVFEKLPIRDAITWNALIGGFSELGYGEESLRCFEMMRFEGVSSTAVTYVCTLKACCSLGAIDKGNALYVEIERAGFLRDIFVGNTLIDMYAKFGYFTRAEEVFDKLAMHDIVSWNALLSGYIEQGHAEEAMECFDQMELDGISPNAVTFVSAMKACGILGMIDKASEIHAKIERSGLLETDASIGSTLLDMYIQCGLVGKAQSVFEKLPIRDAVSWTTLIAGYTEQGYGEEALFCFERMQLEGFPVDAFIFVCSLKACGSIGALKAGQEIHFEIARRGLLENDLVVGNSLVSMYIKCGSLNKAQNVFDQLPVRDMISWNTLLGGHSHLGESEDVFCIFDRMVGEGMKPGLVTFLILLNACSRAGLFVKGQSYFEVMSKDYGLAPTLKHHTCIVDLLSRRGQLIDALSMISDAPFAPDLVTWRTVLIACMESGNVDFGQQAFEHAVLLNEKHAIPYVIMSKIYAESNSPDTFHQRGHHRDCLMKYV